ncbi:MAG: transglycosylase domain-containing protein [Brooklawnia sp.]|uniref:transglycosylase domain-containing protein n=1 Tax=Brooklawnia sp. TaxID=2699740 RepID=UPI003C75923B
MSAKNVGTKTYSLLMFLAVSILAGVLVAGLGLPFAALAAGTTRAAATALQDVPADLAVPPQHEASNMYMADGSLLARFYDQNRQYIPLDQISPEMQMAQIAIEDHRFFEHGAIDLQSIFRAAVSNAAGGTISGGGSTLTQQYVKLVRVQLCNGEKTCEQEVQAPNMDRKILEMRYAVALEQNLAKEEILERYLNMAYYGDGAYGVQAAARHYYNIDASELNVAQAAMLAGLVQNPGATDPVHNPQAALARRNAVLDAQVRYQGMPIEIAEEAKLEGFDASQVQDTPNGCQGTAYPFICDYAQRVITSEQMSSLGETFQDRLNTLNRSGLEIYLTIDPVDQDIVQNTISSVVGPEDAVLAIMNTVDPKTGRIVAMAQSRPVMGDGPGETAWNYSVRYDMGGADGYLFGSTFKVWTAAAAVQQGNFPDTTYYNVRPTQNWRGQWFRGCGNERFQLIDNYSTSNAVAGQTSGNFNMVTGMMWSVNNYWVSLVRDVGACQAVDMAERAGVEISQPVEGEATLDDFNYVPSFTLGAAKVTPLSMAVGYGTFANRGVRCNPIILDSITTRDGVEVPVPDADCQQTIDPQVADAVNYVLNRTHTSGLSASTYVPNGIDQASKTGTSDNSQSSSAFVGYTPDLSTSVVVAGDNRSEAWLRTPEQARNVQTMPLSPLGGRGLGSYSRGDAGALWRPAMEQLMQGMPQSKFEPWVSPVPITPPPGQASTAPRSNNGR